MEIKFNLERIFYALNKAFDELEEALSLMHNYIRYKILPSFLC